ncbi:CsiV family protein [Catenovulum adriaticum]|uniref:Peptidoglycan binding protein CsiV n=1 Tax=Catenovulum adriaticum TaxID=2984846 RepID=A0ABY7AJH5_9ALTE|nr:CsiV family protein [Catenovulum sp. TS8]WAJ69609.1 peptidoglycan binding protein CsiV [Catenovulum sp. TS8]
MNNILQALLCVLALNLYSSYLQAADRWFEVELLIFKRNSPDVLNENFNPQIKSINLINARDLISPQYNPDITKVRALLPECNDQGSSYSLHEPESQTTTTSDFSFDIEAITFAFNKPSWHFNISCLQPQPNLLEPDREQLIALERQHFTPTLPVTIEAPAPKNETGPYLLPEEALQLDELKAKLAWRDDMTPLLHMGWRQVVKSESQETPWRVFAGQNYAKQFQYNGEMVQAEDALPTEHTTQAKAKSESITPADNKLVYNQIQNNIQHVLNKINNQSWQPETALMDKKTQAWQAQQLQSKPEDVWQLDGLFKIYLRHYLYIETEFNLREVGQHPHLKNEKFASNSSSGQPATQDKAFLYPIYFQQNKRIISGEVHYFDHPKMGIVLQVRKYFPEPQIEND